MSEIDGGYAWLVLVAAFLTNMLVGGICFCVGSFFLVFIDHMEGDRRLLALITSLNIGLFYSFEVFASVFINRCGMRMIGMTGGALISAGLILSSFAVSTTHLLLTFGVMTGIGAASTYMASLVAMTQYFRKYRHFAVAFVTVGLSLGSLIFPPIINFLTHEYGWRGAILIVGGISLHNVLCAATYIPITNVNLLEEAAEVEVVVTSDLEKDQGQMLITIDREKETLKEKDVVVEKEDFIEAGSIKTLSPESHACALHFKLHMFRNIEFCFFLVHQTIYNVVSSMMYIHLGSYACSRGFPETAATMLFVYMGIGNTLGRVVFSLTAQRFTPYIPTIYIIAFMLGGVVMCLCPLVRDYILLSACSVAIGVVISVYGSLTGTLIARLFDFSLFSMAYGYAGLFAGFGNVIGGPLASWLHMATGSYTTVFVSAGIIIFISLFFLKCSCLPRCQQGSKAKQEKQQEKQHIQLLPQRHQHT